VNDQFTSLFPYDFPVPEILSFLSFGLSGFFPKLTFPMTFVTRVLQQVPGTLAFQLFTYHDFRSCNDMQLYLSTPGVPKPELPKSRKIHFEFYRTSRFQDFSFTMSHPLVNRIPNMLNPEIPKHYYSLPRRSTAVIFPLIQRLAQFHVPGVRNAKSRTLCLLHLPGTQISKC
jgi:hypothetical protein